MERLRNWGFGVMCLIVGLYLIIGIGQTAWAAEGQVILGKEQNVQTYVPPDQLTGANNALEEMMADKQAEENSPFPPGKECPVDTPHAGNSVDDNTIDAVITSEEVAFYSIPRPKPPLDNPPVPSIPPLIEQTTIIDVIGGITIVIDHIRGVIQITLPNGNPFEPITFPWPF